MTPHGARRDSYAPLAAQPLHAHDEASLSIVLAGAVRETVGARDEEGRAGSIVLKPAGIAHSNLFGPSGAILLSLRSPGIAGAAAAGWHWRHGPAAARSAFALAAALRDGDRFGEAEERLAALLGAGNGANCAPSAPGIPLWLRRIRDRLHADPCTRPSVTSLAREAGVHPVYLTRRFRDCYGAPVSAYVRRLRALLAADRIAAGEPLAQLAHGLNFADQSHLSRVFKAELGISAGRYRALIGGRAA